MSAGSCKCNKVLGGPWLRLQCAYCNMADEVERLQSLIEAVDVLHQIDDDFKFGGFLWCGNCERRWPCPTHRALHPQEMQ